MLSVLTDSGAVVSFYNGCNKNIQCLCKLGTSTSTVAMYFSHAVASTDYLKKKLFYDAEKL